MSVKKQQLPSNQSSLSLNDYYGYDLFSGTSFASRSVPASRRNSSIEKSLLNYSTRPEYDLPYNTLNKPPPRSSSIDVGSLNHSFLNLFLDDESDSSLDTKFQSKLYQSNYTFRSSTPDFGLYTSHKPSFQVDAMLGKRNKYGPVDNSQFYNQQRPFQDVQAAFYGSAARRFSHGRTPPVQTPSISYTHFLQPQQPLDETKLHDYKGKLYELCKDQNGCRFLQTKLEESPMHVDFIFEELYTHFADLMVDPFGNYLCQKLLDHCNDQQRAMMMDIIAPQFLDICLSTHGTRAAQKLIELLATKPQIEHVINALQPHVVGLIRDWNGNHVIQKCLIKLSPENNQFIYDAVSEHCMEVASHKHGCCVYQRCVDNAIKSQKIQLLDAITRNALPLVQDPFGNYVVQYVLEFDDPSYCEELICNFIDHICGLSIQKFSSNVMEKCIQVARKETKRKLIAAVIRNPDIEQLLRDSYGNYVIQTCLDYADENQRSQLVDRIRPLLSIIRNTPYGKRIYNKIQKDARMNHRNTSGSLQGRNLHSMYN